MILPFLFLIIAQFTKDDSKSNDYVRITSLEYKAVVVDEPGSRGKVVITERLTFECQAASEDNPFWELWRALPENYTDGVKVDYKVNSVRQVLNNNQYIIFEETKKLYWEDEDYISKAPGYGPGKWHHSKGPFDDYKNLECIMIYVDGLYRETVVFEIEYEMYNAVLRYADCSELYITLYSEETIKFLDSVKAQILIPAEKMPRPGNYDAYTSGTNSHIFPFRESTAVNPGYYTFSFDLNKSQLNFRPYNQYIEFVLISHGEDRHKFSQYASVNDYYNDNMLERQRQAMSDYLALPEKYKILKTVLFFVFTVISFLTIVIILKVNRQLVNKYKLVPPIGKTDYYREIPGELDPNFAAALVFCKHKISDEVPGAFAAIMLSLVRKEYIEVDRIKSTGNWSQNNVKIIVKNQTRQNQGHWETAEQKPEQPTIYRKSLTPGEEQCYNLIVRHATGGEIAFSAFQYRIGQDSEYTVSYNKKSKDLVKSIGMGKGYLKDADYKKLKKSALGFAVFLGFTAVFILLVGNLTAYQTRLDLAFGAFFILGGGFILGSFLLVLLSGKYVLLSEYGNIEYSKWRALYNFLNSETLLNERTILDVAIWEEYLIYATAFGISEKVIKALQVRFPDAAKSPVLRNPYFRTRSFYMGSNRSFKTATRTATFSSGSGGWSGYGGGGRGGGGGGGGH